MTYPSNPDSPNKVIGKFTGKPGTQYEHNINRFVITGTGRCGTRWFHRLLREIPNVHSTWEYMFNAFEPREWRYSNDEVITQAPLGTRVECSFYAVSHIPMLASQGIPSHFLVRNPLNVLRSIVYFALHSSPPNYLHITVNLFRNYVGAIDEENPVFDSMRFLVTWYLTARKLGVSSFLRVEYINAETPENLQSSHEAFTKILNLKISEGQLADLLNKKTIDRNERNTKDIPLHDYSDLLKYVPKGGEAIHAEFLNIASHFGYYKGPVPTIQAPNPSQQQQGNLLLPGNPDYDKTNVQATVDRINKNLNN